MLSGLLSSGQSIIQPSFLKSLGTARCEHLSCALVSGELRKHTAPTRQAASAKMRQKLRVEDCGLGSEEGFFGGGSICKFGRSKSCSWDELSGW